MIPTGILTAWRSVAPWQQPEQVEQDLMLSRSLVEIYQDEMLSENLLFRGGTALSKLHLSQPVRYSEDLDFVQINPGGIKPFVEGIQKLLSPWLGRTQVKQGRHSTRIYCNFHPENQPDTRRRIKIEINTREHFAVYPTDKIPFKVESEWFSGECEVYTYHIDELAATKLRALYQRKKGRDLFDLFYLLNQNLINPERVFPALQVYLEKEGNAITAKQFRSNLEVKIKKPQFLQDTDPLLLPEVEYDPVKAAGVLLECIDNYWS